MPGAHANIDICYGLQRVQTNRPKLRGRLGGKTPGSQTCNGARYQIMALSEEYKEHLRDLFSGLGPVQIKRMFGGAGLYVDDACFGIVLGGETILMRGDADLGPEFEDAGSEQWVYSNERRGPVAMPYWNLPDSAMDDPEEAASWARKSLVPAQKAAAEKAAAKARKAARKAAEKAGSDG